jgi:hypothetical protein
MRTFQINSATDSTLFQRTYAKQWGVWTFQVSGLKNKAAGYLIPWNRINHASDAFAWIIQLAHKNRSFYGPTVVTDLVDAFCDVLNLCVMHQSALPLDGAKLARAYHAKIKEQEGEKSL